MKLRCRIFGHDTYAYSRKVGVRGTRVLETTCRRCGPVHSLEVPPEGLHWTVLPGKRTR